ncbi:MAG: hypothetical protein IJ689_04240 [Alphaproteobacteria bacterium]|nr:hypothetical protein [Alphaproteobacteria bacterium]
MISARIIRCLRFIVLAQGFPIRDVVVFSAQETVSPGHPAAKSLAYGYRDPKVAAARVPKKRFKKLTSRRLCRQFENYKQD